MMILVILFNGNNNPGDHKLRCKGQHYTPASPMLKLAPGCETVFYKSSAVAEMGDHARAKLAKNYQTGGCCAPFHVRG